MGSLSKSNQDCRVNGRSVKLDYLSSTLLCCTVTPDFSIEVYTLSVSTNYGYDWITAETLQVRAVAVPEIAEATPALLSSNMLTQLRVEFTASGTSDTELEDV